MYVVDENLNRGVTRAEWSIVDDFEGDDEFVDVLLHWIDLVLNAKQPFSRLEIKRGAVYIYDDTGRPDTKMRRA